MHDRVHRVWGHAALAWLALVAIPTIVVSIQWEMGIGRDVDMKHVGELIFTFVMILTLPMGALALGVYAPMAIAIDRLTAGRTSRFVNVLIGAALAVPAFLAVFLVQVVMRWGDGIRGIVENASRRPQALVMASALFACAGITVGLGLRHRQVGSSIRQ